MSRVLVQISLTDTEWPEVSRSLQRSMENLRTSSEHMVRFLIVFQGKNGAEPDELRAADTEIIVTPEKSVSKARNVGINYAQINGFDALLFHDSSLVYEPGFLSIVDETFSAKPEEIVKARIQWGLRRRRPEGFRRSIVTIFRHSYVWSYLFDPMKIGDLRFDERLGPGEKTCITCGEDVLFMLQYISKNDVRFVRASRQVVFHPPRPDDLSKQLAYAEGQGALYRCFLARFHQLRLDLRFTLLVEFLLFAANSIRLMLLKGRRGRDIFQRRLRGFTRNVECFR